MRNDRSHPPHRGLVAVARLWLIVSVLALVAVASIDVEGDLTTSNVTSVVLITDRVVVDAPAVEERVEPGTSIRPSSGRLHPIFRCLLGVRSLWDHCARSIRGP